MTSKTINYAYCLHGKYGNIPFTVHSEVNDYLRDKERSISYAHDEESPTDIDFITRDLSDETQAEYLDPLVTLIQNITPIKDDQARIAISLVQNIPYDYEGLAAGNITGKYPYEVLYTYCGVCSEKSSLLVYLLGSLGYQTAIFRFESAWHDAVGLKCPREYSHRSTDYCFVESTRPVIITDSCREYRSAGRITENPHIIQVTNGISFDSIKEEYEDAITYNQLVQLINMGEALDRRNYDIWLLLGKKYGMLSPDKMREAEHIDVERMYNQLNRQSSNTSNSSNNYYVENNDHSLFSRVKRDAKRLFDKL